MSKVVAACVAGSGAAAVAVGGPYLLQGDWTGKEENLKTQPQAKEEPKLEFEDLNAFTSSPTKSKCVSDYFTTAETNDQTKEINNTDKPTDNTEFFTTSSGDGSGIKSCLKIEFRKTTYKDNI